MRDLSLCIQAGGACGIWPVYLSRYFERVVTFEPDPDNYKCLLQNMSHALGEITAYHGALGRETGKGSLCLDPSELDNSGAFYLVPGQDVKIGTIDNLEVDSCGLIQLDIEGFELEALQGGRQTIEKYRPVVMIEEKPLPQSTRPHTLAREWLQALGYKEVARIHRDVILC